MMTRYFCHLIGEDCAMLPYYHRSTIERIQALGVAIHIPIAIWAVTSYVVAHQVFELSHQASIATSLFCSALVYLLERLIIAVPKVWYVNALRILIGVLIAVLAASTFDLVLFEKEIRASLNAKA